MNVHGRTLGCERLGVETFGPMTCTFCQLWGQRMKLLNPLSIFLSCDNFFSSGSSQPMR